MKTVKFEGTIENAYGKPVSPALAFDGTYQAFETKEEIVNVGEFPSDAEIVSFVNAKRKASERQKAMVQKLTDNGYEKPTLDKDVQLQLKSIYKVLIAAKKTPEEARAIAAATIGAEWADAAE